MNAATGMGLDLGIGAAFTYVVPGATSFGGRTWEEAGIVINDAVRIQNAANRTGQKIIVVGSRARGTAGASSDWDYILSGNSAQRHSACSSLPRGSGGGILDKFGRSTGIDIWNDFNPKSFSYNRLEPKLPHVIFYPKKP